MNTPEGFTHPETDTLQLIKAAFDAPNNRTIIFTAIRDDNNSVIDFEFSLLSRASHDYFYPEELTGKRFTQARPHDVGQLQDMIRVMETGVTNNWERIVSNADGMPQWYNVSDARVGECIVRIWENVTERRLSENHINTLIRQKAEEKYLSLFNSIDQGFCIIEMVFDEKDNPYDYIFLDYNPAFEKQTGLTNVRGKSIKSINPHHEQHWFDLYGGIAISGQPMTFEQEAVIINGWYEVSAFPLTKEKDNKVAVIFNDVTQRKNAEKERIAFNTKLEEEVKERTAALKHVNELLEQKNAELEKSNKDLESFNYVASHDLQEPLRKIQTFLSMIHQRGNDMATIHIYLDKIA